MSPNSRALIFDLDDTLYPLNRFILSGFRAVSTHLSTVVGADEDEIYDVLVRARASGSRGSELQTCVSRYGLSDALLPTLLDVFRNHEPDLLLPMASRAVLESLAAEWRLAVLTNGWPAIQARKVRALGIERLVDVVVYACDVGNGRGKPAPEPFLETAARLGVAPAQAIVVGDDARCDIEGASRVGMKTIHLLAAGDERGPLPPCRSDATIWSLFEVPAIANGLMTGWSSHAA